jgi:hypothetical protein
MPLGNGQTIRVKLLGLDTDVHSMCEYANKESVAEFLDEIQTKVSRVFLLAIHIHLYIFAFRFIILQTHATSYSFYSSVTTHGQGGRRKTWLKTIPPFLLF